MTDLIDEFRVWEQSHNRENYGRYDAFSAGYKVGLRAVLNEIECRKIHMGDSPVLIHPESFRALLCNMLDPHALRISASKENEK